MDYKGLTFSEKISFYMNKKKYNFKTVRSFTREETTIKEHTIFLGIHKGKLVINPGIFFKISTVTTIVAGTIFLMWLGEQITQRGIGNGISLIIMCGILANLPFWTFRGWNIWDTIHVHRFCGT